MNRIEKLMKALPENADAAIITSDVNRRYFTGLGSSAGTLLAFRDAAYFIIDFRYIEVAKATVTGAEVILQDKLYEQLGELLKKHGARTVAIETGYLTVGELDLYRTKLPDCGFSTAATLNDAILEMRSLKDESEIAAIRKAKTDSQTTITQKEQAIREATEKRLACQQKETEALAKARTASDSREEMGREMARLAERKAAAETEYDQTVAKLWDEYQLSVSQAEQLCVEFDSLTALRAQVADLRGKIRALGSVNVSAIEEYKEVKARYDELSRQVTDVEESRNELSRMIAKLSAQMREIFTDSFRAINENFSRVFTELFGGGEASLVLEDESDVLACGIGIRVAPPGKVIKNLEALSGGEQALVAISIYFAILAVNPAPFCILDEIEAALDDANVVRFAQYLRRISDKTQFIVITHRRGTMEAANVLYGVTMQEDGVSKLLKLDLEQVDATLVS